MVVFSLRLHIDIAWCLRIVTRIRLFDRDCMRVQRARFGKIQSPYKGQQSNVSLPRKCSRWWIIPVISLPEHNINPDVKGAPALPFIMIRRSIENRASFTTTLMLMTVSASVQAWIWKDGSTKFTMTRVATYLENMYFVYEVIVRQLDEEVPCVKARLQRPELHSVCIANMNRHAKTHLRRNEWRWRNPVCLFV